MIDTNDMKDICINCGTEYEVKTWGAACTCDNSNVVHQEPCNGCGKIIGQITDDDYCGPEKLYCPECMDKARKYKVNTCQYEKKGGGGEIIKEGDKVYYHPIIGSPHDNIVRIVRHTGKLTNGTPVAWLENKSGCVAIIALTKTEED